MLGTHISHNSTLIPKNQAMISIDNIEFTYGFGVYENIRLVKSRILFGELHITRLLESARLIGLEHILDIQNILRDIKILVTHNKVETANIKILLTGGKTAIDANLYIMMLAPKFLDRKLYRDGVAVITKQYERFLPQAKTLNMLPSYLFYKEAQSQSAYDALLCDRNGCVLEGTRSNFFVIQEKTLITPPLEYVLNGVTRQTVIAAAKQAGYTIKEERIPLSDIFSFDGAFLTNTSHGIVPIRTVDQTSFPNIVQEIQMLHGHNSVIV